MPRARFVWPARLSIGLLFLALCSASLLLWRQLDASQHELVSERVAYQAHSLAQQLEASLTDQAAELRRIALAWSHRGRLPRDEWELDANFALQHFPGYQSIQWLGADL